MQHLKCPYCEYKAAFPEDLQGHKIVYHAEEYYGRKDV